MRFKKENVIISLFNYFFFKLVFFPQENREFKRSKTLIQKLVHRNKKGYYLHYPILYP